MSQTLFHNVRFGTYSFDAPLEDEERYRGLSLEVKTKHLQPIPQLTFRRALALGKEYGQGWVSSYERAIKEGMIDESRVTYEELRAACQKYCNSRAAKQPGDFFSLHHTGQTAVNWFILPDAGVELTLGIFAAPAARVVVRRDGSVVWDFDNSASAVGHSSLIEQLHRTIAILIAIREDEQ